MLSNPRILTTAFSKFESAVDKLLRRNNIRTTPELIIKEPETHNNPFLILGMAQYEVNPNPVGKIAIHKAVASRGEDDLALCIYAHEVGHLLGRHRIAHSADHHMFVDMDSVREAVLAKGFLSRLLQNVRLRFELITKQNKLAKKYRQNEHEADRLMTHLVGSHETAIQASQVFRPKKELLDAELERLLNESKGTLAEQFRQLQARSSIENCSLTFEEAVANINSVDVNDRKWIDRLITEREEMIAAQANHTVRK